MKNILRYSIYTIGLAILTSIANLQMLVLSKKKHTSIYKILCNNISTWTRFCLKLEQSSDIIAKTPLIISSNHQSVFDIPILMAYLAPHGIYPKFVMKKTIRLVPCLRGISIKLSFLAIDRSQPKAILKQIINSAKITTELQDWIIFPEGTRAGVGLITKPKAAGLYWMLNSYKNHSWLHLVIKYTKTGVSIKQQQSTQKRTLDDIDKKLEELWEEKQQMGFKTHE